LTHGNARTIRELFDIVKEVVPDAISKEMPRAADKPIRGTLSTKRAEELLGFKSSWPLEKGYRQYAEWYVDQWARAKQRVLANS
jgi:nucleoside-diphosphate-sugar epimerase